MTRHVCMDTQVLVISNEHKKIWLHILCTALICRFLSQASKHLPKSYAYELLAIKCWERAGQQAKFSLKQVFKDVLTQLTDPSSIDIVWETHYNRSDYENACQKEPGK